MSQALRTGGQRISGTKIYTDTLLKEQKISSRSSLTTHLSRGDGSECVAQRIEVKIGCAHVSFILFVVRTSTYRMETNLAAATNLDQEDTLAPATPIPQILHTPVRLSSRWV